MNNLENNLSIEKNTNIQNNILENLEEKQMTFLETNLGKIVNGAIDIGIKAVLPDWLEDEMIEIKDSVLNEGFKSGVETMVNKAIDVGKKLEGIVTGKFEDINQIKSVIKRGGLVDSISKLLDTVIDWAKKEKIISTSTAKLIKSGKKTIMQTIEDSINTNLENQVSSIEKINGYIEKWTNYFNKQDFTNMKKIYNKIETEMEKIIPLQTVLEQVKQVENLQELIQNNGKNFNLTEEELELANMLI